MSSDFCTHWPVLYHYLRIQADERVYFHSSAYPQVVQLHIYPNAQPYLRPGRADFYFNKIIFFTAENVPLSSA